MGNCLRCKKEIEANTGRRPRKYCSDNCRQRDYQEKKKENQINITLRELKQEKKPSKEAIAAASISAHSLGYILSKIKDPLTETREIPEESSNSIIKEAIAAIKAEKIPEYRSKTTMGRKSWELDQKKRIQELENQLI